MAFTVSRTVELAASMEAVRPLLRDLSTYPKWVPIVSSVTQDGEQHWIVELRVSIGPFARSKQLRMERSVDNDEHIMFTRNESDGRQHAHWELRFDMSDVGSQTSVTAVLEYRERCGPRARSKTPSTTASMLRLSSFENYFSRRSDLSEVVKRRGLQRPSSGLPQWRLRRGSRQRCQTSSHSSFPTTLSL